MWPSPHLKLNYNQYLDLSLTEILQVRFKSLDKHFKWQVHSKCKETTKA